MRQIDSRLAAQSGQFCILRDPIYSKLVADVIKENITGLHDGLVQFDPAMYIMTFEKAAVEGSASPTSNREAIVDHSRFESSHRHDGLEGGSWRELRLNGSIQQRMPGVVQ